MSITNMSAQPFGTGDAVIGAALSPPIHWQHEFSLPDIGSVPHNQEDWYYGLTELKTAGVTTGYLALGYARDVNFTTLTFNDGQGQPLACASQNIFAVPTDLNCGVLALEDNPIRLGRQLAVWYDLDGQVVNYRVFNHGEFWGAVQDTDGSLFLYGLGSNMRRMTDAVEFDATSDPHLTSPIYYNPVAGNLQQFDATCSGGVTTFRLKANVIKLSPSGVVLWNHYYGLTNNLTTAKGQKSFFKSGLLTNNKLLMAGYSVTGSPEARKGFIANINKTTGYVNWRTACHPSTNGEIAEIRRENASNSYVISGFQETSVLEISEGFVARIQDAQNGNLGVSSFQNPVWYKNVSNVVSSLPSGSVDFSKSSKSTSAIFANGKIYWSLTVNRTGNYATAIGNGWILQLNTSGSVLNVDEVGELRAYDLWLSATPTDDGGFATISTRHSPYYFGGITLPSPQTPMDLNNLTGETIGDCITDFLEGTVCTALTDPNAEFWTLISTCSYIRKYNSNFELEWDKIWDSSDNSPRVCFPGNFKQQECMYRIIQSGADGGLVGVGNSSGNQDDSYIVKLGSDCGISDFYGGANGPDIIATYGNTNLNGEDGITNITVNTTWTTPKKVLGTVRVKPGVTLTILNTVVEFSQGNSPHAGIDVEQNGHLIVDNSVLTSGGECDQFWAGIAVWGDTDKHQYSFSGGQYHQGRATIRNNSTIEYAATAVRNWNPGKWDQIGGIIDVKDSEFLNCSRAIEFLSYQNKSALNDAFLHADRSVITKTDFVVNDNIPLDLTTRAPSPQITLWETDRIAISGCDFINSSTVSQSEFRGNAIFSHDANYIIGGFCNHPLTEYGQPCTDLTENTFTGWHKAIEALETVGFRPMTVRNSNFSANMIGVELNGADYSQVYANNFILGGHPFSYGIQPELNDLNHLGIYSNGNLHYSIEDNNFTRPSFALFEGHGVLVFNGGGAENQVYKNNFSGLKTAANGWQVNRNLESEGGVQSGLAGLQFLCNTNTGNFVDFEMSRTGLSTDPNFIDSGMRRRQGNFSPARSAANTFSNSDSDPLNYVHFTLSSQDNYVYYWNVAAPSASEVGPDEMNITFVSTPDNCPSNYTQGVISDETGFVQLIETKSEYAGLLYAYHQLIDDGNTPAAVAEVELTWPEDAWDLRNELIARSPYNSETVLIAAITKNIMPHAMLLEVLLANPDALQNGNVIVEAENVPNPPMPSYMIDLLWAARDLTTVRTSMESTIADLHMEVQRIQKKIILNKAFADNPNDAPDSTLYYLAQVQTVEGNYSRAAALVDRGMFSQAISLLDSMVYTYRLRNDRIAEINHLISLYSLVQGVHDSGRNIARLDESEINTLKGIAEEAAAGRAAQKAQNALCFHYNICYDVKGQPKSKPAERAPKPAYSELLAELNSSSVFPNPANQYVTISYSLLAASASTSLTILDGLGRQMENRSMGETYQGQELMDTRKLPNGVYFYQISQNGKKMSEGKFVVTH